MKNSLYGLITLLLIVILFGTLSGCSVNTQTPTYDEPVVSGSGIPISEFLKGTAFAKTETNQVISVRYTDDTTVFETDDEQQISVFLKYVSKMSIGDMATVGDDKKEAYTLELTFDDGDKYVLSFPSYNCYTADDGAIYQIIDSREPRCISEYAHSMHNSQLIDEARAIEIGIGMTEIEIYTDGLWGDYDVDLNGDGKMDSLQFRYEGAGDEAALGWYIKYQVSEKASEWLTYFRCPEESEKHQYGRLFFVPDEKGGSILILAQPTDRLTTIFTFELSGLSHDYSFNALPISFENDVITLSDGKIVAIQDLVPESAEQSLLHFNDDDGSAKLVQYFDDGNVPEEAAFLYDQMGSNPEITITDPEKIQELYQLLSMVTVTGVTNESITDCYHFVQFKLADDLYIHYSFEGSEIWCYGEHSYSIENSKKLFDFMNELTEEYWENEG